MLGNPPTPEFATMKRPPAALQWLAVFASGAALGLCLGSRGPQVSALAMPRVGENGVAADEIRPRDEASLKNELAQSYEKFRSVDQAFELAARAVAPSVVHIVAKKTGPGEDGQIGRFEESGSGLIIRPASGRGLYVLTNNHVVDGALAVEISISLHDGQVLHPERFWVDEKTDIAVMKLARDDLPAATLGNSDDARVGSWVLALGSPFGLTHSVSQGIISAKGRHEDDLEFDGVEQQEFLQTDAAINPGNSGGPLVNLRGQVIGINTAIASEGGGNEGVGFSIPINLARWAMEQLIHQGKVSRGAIGVNLQELSPQAAIDIKLDRPRGARVVAVRDHSPAATAGLVPGDVILQFNGIDVVNHNHLINLVSTTPIGQTVELVFWRNKARFATKLAITDREQMLAEVPPDTLSRSRKAFAQPPASDLGLSLVALDEKASKEALAGLDPPRGVMITKVEPTSPFVRYLKSRDVLQGIRGQAIKTPEEATAALRGLGNFPPLTITFQRLDNGAWQRKSIQIP